MDEVLVGVDETEASRSAVAWAAGHAAARDTQVVALHAWQLPTAAAAAVGVPGGFYPPALQDVQASERAALALVERATAGLDVKVRTVVESGPAASVVEAHARDCAVLVLGRRDHAALAHALTGSVAGAALHHVDCPVVVVPSGWEPPTDADRPRVVVGFAAGQAADGAMRWAAAEAAARGWPLVPVLVRPAAVPEAGEWSAAELDATALARLREASAAAGAVTPTAPEVLVGSAGEELVRFTTPADLLVVGSRGRGAVAGWLLGSTSSHCAHHSTCPVVVVRDPR